MLNINELKKFVAKHQTILFPEAYADITMREVAWLEAKAAREYTAVKYILTVNGQYAEEA